MKNLLKKINFFGLGLVLAGGLIITAQSAFTSVTDVVWYFNGTEWVLESEIVLEPGEIITCTGADNDCKALFTATADPNFTGEGAPAENYPEYLDDVDRGTYAEIIP